MFNSLMLTPDALDELPAKSSLPWVWFGFLFVAAFIIEETLMFALELDRQMGSALLVMIALLGWAYWFFCLHRFHKILSEVSRQHYPIGGGEAIWKHFIPFYNLVWVFRWASTMTDYLNRRERVKMVSGNLLGAVLLLSAFTARFFDAGIGLTGVFTVGMYISSKLGQHVELIRASTAEMLPPPPDPNWYGGKEQDVRAGDMRQEQEAGAGGRIGG